MSFPEQPAPQGATKINYRANEKKAYRYEAYPGCRYHPDGRVETVLNEEQDKALAPEWRDTPYPQQPIAPPVPAPTLEELKTSVETLTRENAELLRDNADMRAHIAEQMSQQEAKTSKPEAKRQGKG